MKDLSPGHYSRKELPRYFALRPKALASRLAAENPHTARHYAECIARAEKCSERPDATRTAFET